MKSGSDVSSALMLSRRRKALSLLRGKSPPGMIMPLTTYRPYLALSPSRCFHPTTSRPVPPDFMNIETCFEGNLKSMASRGQGSERRAGSGPEMGRGWDHPWE